MKIRYQTFTHSGKTKAQNEDFVLVDTDLALYLVCDGVTHPFGAYCAQTAAQGIRNSIQENREALDRNEASSTASTRQEVGRLLKSAIELTSARLYEEAQQDPKKRGMFSTVAAILFSRGFAFVAHLGDSRIYSVREGNFLPITQDHTFYSELIQAGKSPEEARKMIYSDHLSAAVGYQPFARPAVSIREVGPGERMLLCTDGVSDFFEKGAFRSAWGDVPTDRLPRTLCDHALSRGSRDNVTALAIEWELHEKKSDGATRIAPNILQKLSTIRQIRLFEHLSDHSLTKFLSLADTRTYAAGEALIQRGGILSEMFIVIEGELSIDFGQGPIPGVESKGAVLGEMSLFDGALPYATVTALKPTTVLVVSRDALFSSLREDTAFAARFELGLLQAVIRRLRERTEPDAELRKMSNYSLVSIFPE